MFIGFLSISVSDTTAHQLRLSTPSSSVTLNSHVVSPLPGRTYGPLFSSFRSGPLSPGAQVDLLISRRGTTNEMGESVSGLEAGQEVGGRGDREAKVATQKAEEKVRDC